MHLTLDCPSLESLTAFFLGQLEDAAAASLADHIDQCSFCQQALTGLAHQGGDPLLERLLQVGSEVPVLDAVSEQVIRQAADLVVDFTQSAEGDCTSGEGCEPLPSNLGNYEVIGPIGRGGMGVVYQVVHRSLGKTVAFKVLSPDRMHDAAAVARFQQEMKAVGRLNHPNIVSGHDAGVVEGRHFLVTEFVDGVDLARLVKRQGPLPLGQAAALILQAAQGLEHAHRRGLIHRDIKPSNLMLTQADNGQPLIKILDLGLATLAEPSAAASELPRAMVGTIAYMAPEQAANSQAVDGRADVYSLGATFYTLLTGVPPIRSRERNPALDQPVPSHPLLPWQNPNWPASLKQLLARMLEPDPARRPGMEEVIVRLEGLLKSGTLSLAAPENGSPKAPAEGPATSPASSVQKGRSVPRAWLVVGGLVLLGICLVLLCIFLGGNASPLPPGDPESKKRKTGENCCLTFQPNQFVEVPGLLLERESPYTMEAYIYLRQEFSNTHLLGIPRQSSFFLLGSGKMIHFGVTLTGSFHQARHQPLVPGRRYHVAGVRTKDEVRLYLDGKLKSRASLRPGPLSKANQPFRIGDLFVGCLDEIRISRIARYQDDFLPAPRFTPDKDTLALYHCDDGEGEQLTDSSGNGFHGILHGVAWGSHNEMKAAE